MVEVQSLEYHDVLKSMMVDDSVWAIVTAINFEECSIKLLMDILEGMSSMDAARIKLIPIRLYSSRSSHWGTLEMVRDQFEDRLRQIAANHALTFASTPFEHPVGPDVAYEILASAQSFNGKLPNLILDISALPRELAVFLCDMVCGVTSQSRRVSFSKVFIVQTPPERITSREGLGPFSVGAARCVYSPEVLRHNRERRQKTTLLVFPGYEGFEAKAAVDAVSSHDSIISVAIGCFEDLTFPSWTNVLISNQALIQDAIEGSVDIQYYFTEHDAFRVAFDLVERAVRVCEEFPNYRHAFLVAPFGPKWSIMTGILACREFQMRASSRVPGILMQTDILLLPTSQSISLYSRGARTPRVFSVELDEA